MMLHAAIKCLRSDALCKHIWWSHKTLIENHDDNDKISIISVYYLELKFIQPPLKMRTIQPYKISITKTTKKKEFGVCVIPRHWFCPGFPLLETTAWYKNTSADNILFFFFLQGKRVYKHVSLTLSNKIWALAHAAVDSFSEEKLRAEQIQDLVICNLSTERVKQQEPVAVTYKTSKQETTVDTHQGFQLETDDGSHTFLRISQPLLFTSLCIFQLHP